MFWTESPGFEVYNGINGPLLFFTVFSGLQYLNGLLDLFNDPVLDAGLTKDVVWGDAGLTAVSVLSPGNTPTQ